MKGCGSDCDDTESCKFRTPYKSRDVTVSSLICFLKGTHCCRVLERYIAAVC